MNVELEMDYRRLLPGGSSSSEGSTVGPMVLSLAIFNNLVLTMSSQTGKTLAKRRMQNLDLPLLSRGYGTLVDQPTALDLVFLWI